MEWFDIKDGVREGLLESELFPSLRDQFAMAALQGMATDYSHSEMTWIAIECYKIADAMLEERKKK